MSSEAVKNFFEDDEKEQVYWSSVRQIKVTSEDSDKIHVRSEFDGEWQVISVFRKKKTRANQPNENVDLLLGLPLKGISKEKKKDLLDLCKTKQIPEMYTDFYEQLFENMTDENEVHN